MLLFDLHRIEMLTLGFMEMLFSGRGGVEDGGMLPRAAQGIASQHSTLYTSDSAAALEGHMFTGLGGFSKD